QLRHDVFHAAARGGHQTRLAPLGFTRLRDFLGQTLVFHDDEIVTGFRHAGQTQHLHRDRRAGTVHLAAGLVEQGTYTAILDTAHQIVALLELALLYQHRRHRATALVQ